MAAAGPEPAAGPSIDKDIGQYGELNQNDEVSLASTWMQVHKCINRLYMLFNET